MWLNSYREHGSTAPLKLDDQSEDSLRTSVGARLGYETTALGKPVFAELRASWQHEFAYQALPITAKIAETDGPAFTTEGPEIGQDSCLLGASVSTRWTDRCRSRLSYNIQLGRDNYASHSLALTFECQY